MTTPDYRLSQLDELESELRTRATQTGRGLPVVDPQRVEMSRIGG